LWKVCAVRTLNDLELKNGGNGGSMMKPVGLIFDLDGTLADTLDDITNSINDSFVQAGFDPVTRDRIRTLIGYGLRDLLKNAHPPSDENLLTTLIDGYRRIYRERMLQQTRLYAGVAEFLDQLTASNIPLAVLSNKPHEFTVPICESLLSRWPFVRFCGSSEDWLKKPDPTTAIQMAEEMECKPECVFFVGDSSVDIETAKNAGMKSIAVTWGYREVGELHAADSDFCIHKPSELMVVLSR